MKLNEAQTARLLIVALQEVRREIDPEMPVQQLLTFLVAARSPNIPMQDVMSELDISSASISRNAAALGRVNRRHEKGHDLLEAREDVMERRRKVLHLTNAGSLFMQRLAQAVSKQLVKIGD